ncbi:MAG: WbqC family protein [Rubricoccaceae bacterium]|nr:WbqC family protein [Rubricoccaceae bacterium]
MVAIRPPEYFPRLEYCALMLAAERFVVADTFPFSRQSWHNRTKLRTADEVGWQWLTIPRRHGGVGIALNELEIANERQWARTHRRALEVNYRMAPFYEHFADELFALLRQPWQYLGQLTVATVRWAHDKIGAPSELIVLSDLGSNLNTLQKAWTAVGNSGELITLPESAEGDAQQLSDVGVQTFEFEEHPGAQTFPGFVPGLSMLDMLFNHGSA